ncbi:ABC transporter permease [Candidatus Saganbacteria bacterium CG08_land_8_20_14_0_20_45_16]|uniref:ABC transporter permease n=1 Tax=Candidatus Saganbacteria bacterium CG08_land_8_20_14_0_20_45_16 TaxID=2014293 RepID=A0A2H0XXW0_UNCSA|nr:MAG: ABC transporter permease [Candidatus Saganbacteria bacterium CG08_land_8_20_14_0_20_45_16]
MPYEKFLEQLGQKVEDIFAGFGYVTILFLKVLANLFQGKMSVKLTLEQMVKIGVESLPLALTTSAFVGMVFAMQIAGEFTKFGAGKFVGGVMAIAMARELGPAITGIVVAARVAAAITAEIGTMKVTEQIDALQALGATVEKYLVIPRFIATTIMLPLLTVLTILTGFWGSYLVAVYIIKINPTQYLDNAQYMLRTWDIWCGLIKTAFFGMIIAIIACYRGLNTKGGAKGVGEATTSSVVTTLIALFIVNYFLSVLFFK